MVHDAERATGPIERRGCGAVVKGWAKTLKRQVATLYFAYRHPGTPWYSQTRWRASRTLSDIYLTIWFLLCGRVGSRYAKALVLLVLCYALSPIDLIPDFIPV